MKLPQQSSHWYKHEDGIYKPFFEVPRKDGKGMRKPNITDARAMGLAVSVTTVLKVIAKPAVENYVKRNIIMAAMTLPRLPGETEDAFAQRIIEDAESHSIGARDFGTRMHDTIERYLGGRPILGMTSELANFFLSFQLWANENVTRVYSTEKIVGDAALGYAGTLDLHCDLRGVGECVVDFKSQAVKNDKPVWYPEFQVQLAAYSAALNHNLARVSVVIDSKTPRAPFVHVWPKGMGGYYLFLAAFDWWKYLNDYDPRPREEDLPTVEDIQKFW